MTRRASILTYIIVVICFSLVSGQIAEDITLKGKLHDATAVKMNCANQDAGTYIFQNGRGESRDLTAANLASMPNQIFLCKGDSFDIVHSGGNLMGDPDPSTPGGFGYAIYECPPSVSGPSLDDIVNNDCEYDNLPTSPLLLVTQGRTDGNVTFFNECFFQEDPLFARNRTLGDPVEIHFAPITFDALDGSGRGTFEVDPVSPGPAGPCVNVNTPDRFSVVYLNEISLDITVNVCNIAITIDGGYPEYARINGDLNPLFDVTIVDLSDPARVIEDCSGNQILRIQDDNPRDMAISASGQYQFIIEDQFGCPLDTIIDINIPCDTAFINTDPLLTTGDPGDIVCIDFTGDNVNNVFGFELYYLFDNSVAQFVEIRNSVAPFTVQGNDAGGRLIMNTGAGTGSPVSYPDGTRLFTACFELLNRPGECTTLTEDPAFFSGVLKNLCTRAQAPSVIQEPTLCVTRQSTIDLSACSSDVGDGRLIFGPTTGNGPFEYEVYLTSDLFTILRFGTFDNIGDIITEVGLNPGDYTIRIMDADGTVEEDNILITDDARLQIIPNTFSNPSCPGDSDGLVLTNGTTGGVDPIFTEWSNGVQNMDRIGSLPVGRYVFTAVDRYGCVDSLVQSLTVDSIFIDFTAERLTDCPNDTNGIIFAQARGGNGPYTLVWDNTIEVQNDFTSRNNRARGGNNAITVRDQNGCVARDTFFLESVNVLNVDVDFENIRCAGEDNGSITITPQSGQGPYTYEWQDIGFDTGMRTMLTEGLYNVIVTDAAGCFDSISVAVVDPDSVIVSIDSINSTNFICPGDADGTIFLDVQVEPGRNFTLSWNGGNLDGTLGVFNLDADRYQFTLRDERGCEDTASYEIFSALPIMFTIPDIDIPDCPGDTTTLTVSDATGGAGGPYQFRVDNGSTFFNLGEGAPIFSGTRTVEIVDAQGCTRDTVLIIGDAEPVRIFTENVNITLGDSIRLVPDIRPITARDSIVSFQWITADGTQEGLSCYDCLNPFYRGPEDQVYTVIATDVNGCTYEATLVATTSKVRNVFLPNAFIPETEQGTPGRVNGRNDILHIGVGPGVERINYFRVFNRLGDMVFNAENILPAEASVRGWDGRIGETLQNPGVYVYVAEVQFIDGEVIVYRSDATLIN